MLTQSNICLPISNQVMSQTRRYIFLSANENDVLRITIEKAF